MVPQLPGLPLHPRWAVCAVSLLLVLPDPALASGEADQLIELINQSRAAPANCEGRALKPMDPLAPNPTLSSIHIQQGDQLQSLLRDAGYQASNAQALAFAGPDGAEAAMGMIEDRYCGALFNSELTEIGVRQQGNQWQIIVARPLLDADLGDWREAGKAVLARVNQARSASRRCGDAAYEPAQALVWNDRLAAAALAHSEDMAQQGYFSHADRAGQQVDSRASDQGYRFSAIGENIAAGQGAVDEVMAGWLSSPEHCANIMEPSYTEMGAAYALNPDGDVPIVWTQVFGKPLQE